MPYYRSKINLVRKQRTDIYTNNIRFGTAALLIAAFLVASASAGAAIDELDRFKLWNECSPIELAVPDLSEDAGTIGLAKDTIEVTVRSRLRAARLYNTTEHVSILSVSVTVLKRSFGVNFAYIKYVTDYATKIEFGAITWNAATIGTHGQSADYILGFVARHTDKFIDEYLRVNADACE